MNQWTKNLVDITWVIQISFTVVNVVYFLLRVNLTTRRKLFRGWVYLPVCFGSMTLNLACSLANVLAARYITAFVYLVGASLWAVLFCYIRHNRKVYNKEPLKNNIGSVKPRLIPKKVTDQWL